MNRGVQADMSDIADDKLCGVCLTNSGLVIKRRSTRRTIESLRKSSLQVSRHYKPN